VGLLRIFGGFARVAVGRRGVGLRWVAGWLSLSTSHCHNPFFFVFFFFFFLICQICLIRCCQWVCEVALGGGGGFWSILVVKGACDYCFFIANKSNNNNNNNKIINKNKTRNYLKNTCQTNFLFSKLLKYCS
jgi:hypothetical protein